MYEWLDTTPIQKERMVVISWIHPKLNLQPFGLETTCSVLKTVSQLSSMVQVSLA